MQSKVRCILLLLAVTIALVSSPRAVAWGNTGHEAVAYVAWQQMTPIARARAIELIKLVPTLAKSDGTSAIPGYKEWVIDLPPGLTVDQKNLYLFMRAATWADSIKHKWLKDSDTPPADRAVEVNIGFTDQESHGYWHFIDTGFTSDHSTVPATPVPNVTTQVAALRLAVASGENEVLEAYDLVWLEHLVGDIHQPLHGTARYFSGKSDIGGNLVKIKLTSAMKKKFEGTRSKTAPRELHAFWDDLPGEGQPAAVLPDAVTFASELSAATDAEVAVTDADDWAAESLALAKSDAYHAPIGKGLHPAGSNSSSSGYLISTTYYDTAMQDAKVRVALAGARLAKLLNENLK
jgi:hypothetical protein